MRTSRAIAAFFISVLPARHANAFHYTPREQFEAAVASLDGEIAHLDSDAIWTGMQRIVALVGDGHSYLQPRAMQPICRSRSPGSEKIIGSPARLRGWRVLKVHETPVARAAEIVLPSAARDENPHLAQAFVEDALTTGATLHGLHATPDRDAAPADDAGREFSIEVRAAAPGAKLTPIWPFQQPPLYREIPACSSGADIFRMHAHFIAMFTPCEICTPRQRRC